MKNSYFHARLAALPLAVAAAFPALAQNQLKETVVTATRSESRADALISDVTVITRDEIERSTGRTLVELLARKGGVQLTANGALGKLSGVFIRGTEARHALLLVDGVRYGSATSGQPIFDTLPLEMIERIEVLKGPASALYGSDAVGGVIQVFTRKGVAGFHPFGSVTVGSNERSEVAAGMHGGTGNVSYALGVQTLAEKGISATNPKVPFGSFNGDTDAYSQNSVNASVNWTLTPGWKVAANLLGVEAVSHYDNGPGAFDARARLGSRVMGLGVEGKLTQNLSSRLAFGRSQDTSIDMAAAAETRFNTERDQITWLNELATPVGKLLLGYEQVAEKVDSSTAYTVGSRTIDSLMLGLNGTSGPHSWQANLRRDSNSQFGEAATGLVGYGFRFTPNWRAHASHGTSFKAPSFNQLYFPVFGNATTQPEQGTNSEATVAYNSGVHDVSLTYYNNRIKGFITNLPVVVNIPFARLEGVTLAYAGQLGPMAVRATLDQLDARNELNGRKLNRRADQQVTLGVDYAAGAWKFGTTVLSQSERFDDVANTVRLGGFATVDLYADYQVNKDWALQARLNNITDASYQTAQGYNQYGASLYVTLRYSPK